MANFRCFDSPANILNAQERSLALKRCTIQSCIQQDVQMFGTANPKKKINNKGYNFNLVFRPTKCLTNARSYDLKSSYETPVPPLNVTTSILESWRGNDIIIAYQPDVQPYGDKDLTTLNWAEKGVVDASQNLFYDPCFENYPNINRPESWLSQAVQPL